MTETLPEEAKGSDNVPANSEMQTLPHELGPILELLPEENRQQALILMTRVVSRAYRGPVPDAEDMQKYKSVDPTFPERFVRIAEREQEHRHGLDSNDQKNDYDLKKSGQNKAFYALIVLLAVVLALVFMKETTVAGILAGTTIVGVVGMFITGRYLEYKSEQTEVD